MHCEDARSALLEPDTAAAPAALEQHLQSCDDCRALSQDIHALAARARVWHDLEPPPWNPHPGSTHQPVTGLPAAGRWTNLLQQWLPLLASSAALLLAAAIYLQPAELRHATPAVTPAAAPAVMDAASAGDVLAVSREERRAEIEALTAVLKAEMDRRSLETEQSLKYIISHQIQSQRQLDSLRGQLRAAASPGEQL